MILKQLAQEDGDEDADVASALADLGQGIGGGKDENRHQRILAALAAHETDNLAEAEGSAEVVVVQDQLGMGGRNDHPDDEREREENHQATAIAENQDAAQRTGIRRRATGDDDQRDEQQAEDDPDDEERYGIDEGDHDAEATFAQQLAEIVPFGERTRFGARDPFAEGEEIALD